MATKFGHTADHLTSAPSPACMRRLKVVTIEPALFLFTLGLIASNAASQQLLLTKYCYKEFKNYTICGDHTTNESHELQALTSRMLLYGSVATLVPMTVASIFFGIWSDRGSRKYPVVVPFLGSALAYGWWSLQAANLHWDPAYTLAGGFIQGASGHFAASLLTSYSYLTAVVPVETRTFRIAVAEGVMGLAVLIGSFTSGLMLQNLGLVVTFVVMAAISLAGALYSLLWLDDVRAPPAADADTESSRVVVSYVKFLFLRREGYKSTYLRWSLVAYFIGFCGLAGVMDVLYLFLTQVREFSPTMYGVYTGTDYGLKVSLGMTSLVVMRKVLKMDDVAISICGCISAALGYGLIGASTQVWMIWLATVVGALQFLYSIGIRSFISNLVAPFEQGRAFALMACGQSVFTFVASIVFNSVYPASLQFYPGLSFSIASLLSVIAFVILSCLSLHRMKYRHYEEIAGTNVDAA